MRNLGVIFDQHMSFNVHFKEICQTAFLCVCNISKSRNILSDAEKSVHAFVTSRLDYCPGLLSSLEFIIKLYSKLLENPTVDPKCCREVTGRD